MSYKYRNIFTFEERKNQSEKMLSKYPERVPIICEKAKSCSLDDLVNIKYLVANDMTFGQFIYVIRKYLKLTPEKALYLTINNIIPPTSLIISSLYNEYKSEDGFLYIIYNGENTFGNN